MKKENPFKQLNYLQQCLSSDKKPLGLFLGAGCPFAIKVNTNANLPLIPDIAGITKIIRDEMAKNQEIVSLFKIIESHFEKDGHGASATVEDMLTHIRALRAVAGNDKVRGLSANELEKLDNTICQLIYRAVDKELPNTGTPYHSIAAWVRAVHRESPIEIFTVNYDLLMEQAFEDHRVPYFDGFAGVRKPFFDLRAMEEDELPRRWARLWKLHGSINWYQVEGKGVFRGSSSKENDEAMRVIHPSHQKYQESRRMPYLAMIDRLRAFLKQPTAMLILCGYSFRDEHINEVILQGLESTQTAIAFVLLFDSLASYPHASALAGRCSKINVLARDAAIINSQECLWPEKDSESAIVENNKWVKWTLVDPANEKGNRRAEFVLGDFRVFGQFIQELVGSVQQLPEANSGK